MRLRRLAWPVLGTAALLLTGGCHVLRSCNNPATYSGAKQIPPLKMPVGLDGPDTSQAVKIPPLSEPELPRAADASCLEDPPVWEGAAKSAAQAAAETAKEPTRKSGRPPRATR